ncbi:response regulator transcription factor [Streptomyces venezuelae]|uniref:response regulator transcription factor n=1 Tax=Streptomyces venezuelae TaxID=54571 RepID=UPI001680BF64|nr:response regulator transcription factor [Streptomyces venezuelae]
MAEERDVYRNGLLVLLSQIADAEVIGIAVDREELARQSALLRPDVLVAGASLVVPDGFPPVSRLPGGDPVGTPGCGPGGSIMVAECDTDELLRAALAAGAHSYLPLSAPREDFGAALRAVAAGGAFLPADVTRRLFGNFHLVPRRADEPVELRLLSKRERQVLLLIGGGSNNREIARNLMLSEATVKSHVSRILAKLKLRDRVHVAQLVWQLGLDAPHPLPQR